MNLKKEKIIITKGRACYSINFDQGGLFVLPLISPLQQDATVANACSIQTIAKHQLEKNCSMDPSSFLIKHFREKGWTVES